MTTKHQIDPAERVRVFGTILAHHFPDPGACLEVGKWIDVSVPGKLYDHKFEKELVRVEADLEGTAKAASSPCPASEFDLPGRELHETKIKKQVSRLKAVSVALVPTVR